MINKSISEKINTRFRFIDSSHKPLMWTVAILILGCAPIGRPVQKHLREILTSWLGTEGMMIFMLVVFLGAGIAFVYASRLWILPAQNICFTIVLLLAGIIYSFNLPLPEERIHLIQFGLLGLLACPSLKTGCGRGILRLWKPLLFVILIGAADEFIQWFLPDRFFDLRDILFNAIGGFWGVLLFLTVKGGCRTGNQNMDQL